MQSDPSSPARNLKDMLLSPLSLFLLIGVVFILALMFYPGGTGGSVKDDTGESGVTRAKPPAPRMTIFCN